MGQLDLDEAVDLRVRYSTALIISDTVAMREVRNDVWTVASRLSDKRSCPAVLAEIEELAQAWKSGLGVQTWVRNFDAVEDTDFRCDVRDVLLERLAWAERVKSLDPIARLSCIHGMLIHGPIQAKLAVHELINQDSELRSLFAPQDFERVHMIRVDGLLECEDEPGAFEQHSYIVEQEGSLSLVDARERALSALEISPIFGVDELDHRVVLFNAAGDMLSMMDLQTAEIQWTGKGLNETVALPHLQQFLNLQDEVSSLRGRFQFVPGCDQARKLQLRLHELWDQVERIADQYKIVGRFTAQRSPSPSELGHAPLEGLAEIPVLRTQIKMLREDAAYESGWDNFTTAERLREQADQLRAKAELLLNAARILPELPIEHAQPGHSYRGVIHVVGSEYAIQIDTEADRLVRHDLRYLVGETLAAGQAAEVRYPNGQVGLVSLEAGLQSRGLELAHSHGISDHQRQQSFTR
ncbi:KfrB domain-containing protein [Pollutimonas bauzanensis]|uniref:KfrB domain-containing protein n=1 Tax=Pollutimonas bauzanensis TaxID=658167 RepID=A0A1M5YIM3_9BURK|nr:hypothetical protein [Pollutimonas bauzanensis]SHI11393.1 hypothetical protein SAMN04488135_10989 [Pollutimonas bauzanensis]